MRTGAVIAIQDMGAAGLTSSAVEMGAKGDLGIELDLDAVPCREPGMTAYEMMLSESQERMLMVLDPAKQAEAEAVFRKWGLDFAVIGRTTDTLRFVVRHGGEVKADLPIKELGDEAPLYDRPPRRGGEAPRDRGLRRAGARCATGTRCSTSWARRTSPRSAGPGSSTTHLIGGDTIVGPGGADAAVVRVEDGPKGLALTADVTARYCAADAVEGGPAGGGGGLAQPQRRRGPALGADRQPQLRQPGEAPRPWASSSAASAASGRPPARSTSPSCRATSPSTTRPAAAASCRPPPSAASASSTTWRGSPARPSWPRARRCCWSARRGAGSASRSTSGTSAAAPRAPPPPVDLAAERRHGDFVRTLVRDGRVTAVHDLSDGGLAVGLAEMGLARGIGARLDVGALGGLPSHAALFGEDQGRYLVTCTAAQADAILELAGEVPVDRIGTTGGTALRLPGEAAIEVAEIRRVRDEWMPRFMGQAAG